MDNNTSPNQLSEPMLYEGDSINDILNMAMSTLYHRFIKEEVKPKYNSKDIFFDMSKKYQKFTLHYSERFLHIASLDIDDTKYDILFCENDSAKRICPNACEKGVSSNTNFYSLARIECVYRINRIHWIPEIIQLANNDSPQIQEWDYRDRGSNNKACCKRYIRYVDKEIDYVIILRERKSDYLFVTAFPVLTKRCRAKFNRDYEDYINKKAE